MSSRELHRPRPIAPFDFAGPFTDSQPFGAHGIIKQLPSAVAAGGSVTFAHGLGRVPVWVTNLVNGAPGYPSRCYISSATSSTATVVCENALATSGTFFAFT